MLLKGQEGAKKFLTKYTEDVSTIPFQAGAIDTMDDYKTMIEGVMID